MTAERLVAELAKRNWRGAIVGPHGSGKTTLLETLKPVLSAAGCLIHAVSLHGGQRRLPAEFFLAVYNSASSGDAALRRLMLIVDGYEQLGWFARMRLDHFCRRLGAGLLVTAHATCGIPALMNLAPEASLVEQLVVELCAKVSAPITKSQIAASLACHGSNVRETFFALYDQHERLRRGA
jgi:hypothetical protein